MLKNKMSEILLVVGVIVGVVVGFNYPPSHEYSIALRDQMKDEKAKLSNMKSWMHTRQAEYKIWQDRVNNIVSMEERRMIAKKKKEEELKKQRELEQQKQRSQLQSNSSNRGGSRNHSGQPSQSHSSSQSVGSFTVTAYDDTPQSQGKWVGKTASGFSLTGHSRTSAMCIAVDPRVIPLGSRVKITFHDPAVQKYNGVYTAYDTGGAIKGNRIDLFMGGSGVRQEVRNFGRRSATVEIVK